MIGAPRDILADALAELTGTAADPDLAARLILLLEARGWRLAHGAWPSIYKTGPRRPSPPRNNDW